MERSITLQDGLGWVTTRLPGLSSDWPLSSAPSEGQGRGVAVHEATTLVPSPPASCRRRHPAHDSTIPSLPLLASASSLNEPRSRPVMAPPKKSLSERIPVLARISRKGKEKQPSPAEEGPREDPVGTRMSTTTDLRSDPRRAHTPPQSPIADPGPGTSPASPPADENFGLFEFPATGPGRPPLQTARHVE